MLSSQIYLLCSDFNNIPVRYKRTSEHLTALFCKTLREKRCYQDKENKNMINIKLSRRNLPRGALLLQPRLMLPPFPLHSRGGLKFRVLNFPAAKKAVSHDTTSFLTGTGQIPGRYCLYGDPASAQQHRELRDQSTFTMASQSGSMLEVVMPATLIRPLPTM